MIPPGTHWQRRAIKFRLPVTTHQKPSPVSSIKAPTNKVDRVPQVLWPPLLGMPN